jgi:hypothetical protein
MARSNCRRMRRRQRGGREAESESPSPRQDGVLCAEEAEAACAAGGGTTAQHPSGHAKGRLWPGSVRSTFVLRRTPRNAVRLLAVPSRQSLSPPPPDGRGGARGGDLSGRKQGPSLCRARRDVAGDLRLSQRRLFSLQPDGCRIDSHSRPAPHAAEAGGHTDEEMEDAQAGE